MAVAGCSQAGRPAGSFTIAQQWEPRSLNPALENGTSSSEWGLLVFSYLVKYDDRGQLIPDVATVVPTLANGGISRDGLTITYHIRQGIRFADGVALTAADCAWSIDAINNPANNVQTPLRLRRRRAGGCAGPDDARAASQASVPAAHGRRRGAARLSHSSEARAGVAAGLQSRRFRLGAVRFRTVSREALVARRSRRARRESLLLAGDRADREHDDPVRRTARRPRSI